MSLPTDRKLNLLFDKNTFTEILTEIPSLFFAGYGQINGRKVYIHGHKNTHKNYDKKFPRWKLATELIKVILEDPHPLILFLENHSQNKEIVSFVGVPNQNFIFIDRSEGATGNFFSQFPKLLGVAPVVGAVFGNLVQGFGIRAATCNACVIEKGSSMSLGFPDTYEILTGKKLSLDELGGVKVHTEEAGTLDEVVDNEESALRWIKEFLSYMPSNYKERVPLEKKSGVENTSFEFISKYDAKSRLAYDVRKFIKGLIDEGSFFELKPHYAKEIATCFGRVDGVTVGFVGNNSVFKFGAIYPDTSKKIIRFITLCDSFNIPIVFLADTPGFMSGPEFERSGNIKFAASLFSTLSQLTVPKIQIVIRKAYSASVWAMCGSGFADLILAVPGVEVGLYTESLHNKLAEKQTLNDAEKTNVKNNIEDALNMSKHVAEGHIDKIVKPTEIRDEIVDYLKGKKISVNKYPKRTLII